MKEDDKISKSSLRLVSHSFHTISSYHSHTITSEMG